MEFEKGKLMANINDLIKERGRKIGELEDAVGVSRGYLSRMSKAENESMPGVDLIYRLADELEEVGALYLMNRVMATGRECFVKFFELVAFSASDGEMIPICSTLMDRGLNGTMLDLFNCIEMHDKDLKISDRAKRLMAVYLNKHSDDLPFN